MTSFDSNSQDTVCCFLRYGFEPFLTLNTMRGPSVVRVFITHQWSGAAAPSERHAEVRLGWNDEGITYTVRLFAT